MSISTKVSPFFPNSEEKGNQTREGERDQTVWDYRSRSMFSKLPPSLMMSSIPCYSKVCSFYLYLCIYFSNPFCFWSFGLNAIPESIFPDGYCFGDFGFSCFKFFILFSFSLAIVISFIMNPKCLIFNCKA